MTGGLALSLGVSDRSLWSSEVDWEMAMGGVLEVGWGRRVSTKSFPEPRGRSCQALGAESPLQVFQPLVHQD